MAVVCYALLFVAWIINLVAPQLFVEAEVANVVAGYVNSVQVGYHWDAIAIGDRLSSAASFLLVGYMSIKTQEFAREAGAEFADDRAEGRRINGDRRRHKELGHAAGHRELNCAEQRHDGRHITTLALVHFNLPPQDLAR